jgi:hypothetical protein
VRRTASLHVLMCIAGYGTAILSVEESSDKTEAEVKHVEAGAEESLTCTAISSVFEHQRYS